ncbi:MAG TPA: hypothetical protein VME46_24050 [Acidimicrobiales bacterium]|nr:hypothetical protein [Acidimicrobiales bacterium]
MLTLVAPKERSDHAGVDVEALIAEARARRRRRWTVGALSAALVAGAVATWLEWGPGGRPGTNTRTAAAARLSAATSCASAMTYGPLPVWARAGFHPANMAMPYVLGAHGEIVAVLWARHDPLHSPAKPEPSNKILWVSRVPMTTSGNLEISARRLVGETLVGPIVQRTVIGGPGPSEVDMPQSGCWQFSLRWPGYQDSVDLAYAPTGR